MKKIYIMIMALAMTFILNGCASPDYSQYYKLSPEHLQVRQVQTGIYETNDEEQLLTASTHVLQDLGYIVEKTDFDLGFLTCYKDREAIEADQVVGRFLVALLAGVDIGNDVAQRIKVTLVISSIKDNPNKKVVRVSFVRAVTNTHNVTRYELILEPAIYQDFFNKLSQSVFLTAEKI